MITSYDQGRFLEERSRSALEQDYGRSSIVVDGGSKDGSVETIRRYEDRLAWWTSEPDAGQAAALNKGFARARGDVLGWLALRRHAAARRGRRVVAELRREPEPLLVYGDALFVDEDGGELFPLTRARVRRGRDARRCENFVVQPGSLFTRRAWELAGPLDEDSHYFFDFEFASALSRGTGSSGRSPTASRRYRVHAASKSGGASLVEGARLRALRRTRSWPTPPSGRASAYLAAGDYFYDARRLSDARRALVRSLRLRPSRRGAGAAGAHSSRAP